MADREQLHALVNSLPDGALDSALQYLTAVQSWPPKPPEYPPDVQQTIKELKERRDGFLKHGSGSWMMREDKSHVQFGESERNWTTGELTIRTFRVHYDFPMELTEKLLMKNNDQTSL